MESNMKRLEKKLRVNHPCYDCANAILKNNISIFHIAKLLNEKGTILDPEFAEIAAYIKKTEKAIYTCAFKKSMGT